MDLSREHIKSLLAGNQENILDGLELLKKHSFPDFFLDHRNLTLDS